MPIPGPTAPSPPASSVERPLTACGLDRLAEAQFGFLREETRKQSSFLRSFWRGMTLAFRPQRIPEPTFIRDDRTALALDWYMVGQDMRRAMGAVERSDPTIRKAMHDFERSEPSIRKLVEQVMKDMASVRAEVRRRGE